MFEFRADAYGPTIAGILAPAENGHRLMPLAAGRCASQKARAELRRLDRTKLFPGKPIASTDFAEAARAGLFLYLSCLDDCHSIAQEIESTTGSYWHGIMHRQEPDFSNAGCWFRRVKQHEIFPALLEVASEIIPEELRSHEKWDPFWFIDACEAVHRRPDAAREEALLKIQRAEWQLLFDHSCRHAVASPA